MGGFFFGGARARAMEIFLNPGMAYFEHARQAYR